MNERNLTFTPLRRVLSRNRSVRGCYAGYTGEDSRRRIRIKSGASRPNFTIRKEVRLTDMEAMRVDVQFVPSPSQQHDWADLELRTAVSRAQNAAA